MDAFRPSCWRDERTLLGTIYANRAIHTHAASIMNTHIDAIGGLVSNSSDREIRGSSALAAHAAPLDLDVGTFSWDELQVAKHDIGQLSNRKLIDPSVPECRFSAYVGKITRPATHGAISVPP